jgi:hypothetical protein
LAESNSLAEEAISTIRTVKSFASKTFSLFLFIHNHFYGLDEDEEIRLFSKKNDLVRKYSIRQAFYCKVLLFLLIHSNLFH